MTIDDIAKLLDRKLDEKFKRVTKEFDTLNARVARVEDRKLLRSLEKAVTANEGRLLRIDEKLSKVPTRDEVMSKSEIQSQFQKLEQRLSNKFKRLFDFLDKDVMENRKEIKAIKQRLGMPL